MTDHTDDRLEAILQSVMWGDYQRPDGRWGRGVGNRDAIKQAIRQLIREEQEALLKRILDTKSEAHSMSRSVGNTVYVVMPQNIETELAALRQERL
jgi:hypothetical protein